MAPMELRLEAWERLAKDLPTEKINDISSTQPMSQLTRLADDIVAGKTRGRIIIDVNAQSRHQALFLNNGNAQRTYHVSTRSYNSTTGTHPREYNDWIKTGPQVDSAQI